MSSHPVGSSSPRPAATSTAPANTKKKKGAKVWRPKATSSSTAADARAATAAARTVPANTGASTTAAADTSPRTGSVAVSAKKTTAPTISAAGTMAQTDSKKVYTCKNHTMFWTPKGHKKPLRYALTLEIPLQRDVDTYDQAERAELVAAANEYAKTFLADVQARLEAADAADKNPLTPGQDIKALMDDQGYLLFNPTGTIDPLTHTRDEIAKLGALKGDGEQAVELGRMIGLGDPQAITKGLEKPVFDGIREDAAAKAEKEGHYLPPRNLVNHGANCFVNSPFLHLVNLARIPAIRKELKNPDNFKNGAANPLFKAIQGYLRPQTDKKTESYDLGNLAADIRIDEKRQDDVDHVWHQFEDQLAVGIAKTSPLRALFADKLTIAPRAGTTAEKLMQDCIDAPTSSRPADSAWKTASHPDVFTVYVGGRVASYASDLTALDPAVKVQMINDLIAHRAASDATKAELITLFPDKHKPKCDDIGTNYAELFNLTRTLNQPNAPKQRELLNRLYQLQALSTINEFTLIRSDSADNLKIALADILLATAGGHWDSSLTWILTQDQKTAIHAARTVARAKDETPVDLAAPVTLKAGEKQTEYELVSFSWHKGDNAANGHYITYEKRGEEYWEINDLEKVSRKLPDKTEFLEKAKTGTFAVYAKKGLASDSAETVAAATKPAGNKELVTSNLHGVTVTAEEGSLAKVEDHTLVNPTDASLTQVDDQIAEAAGVDKAKKRQMLQDHKVNKVAKRGFFGRKTKGDKVKLDTGINYVLRDSLPDVESVHHSRKDGRDVHVLHVAAGTWQVPTKPEEQEKYRLHIDGVVTRSVTSALEEAAKQKLTKVAFPLMIFPGYSEGRAYSQMTKAIQEFITNRANDSRVHSIQSIKIVLTKEQREQVAAFSAPATSPAPAATAAPAAPAKFQLDQHTTLTIDQSAEMPTALGMEPVSLTPAPTLERDLTAALSPTEAEVIIDFTKGTGSASPTTTASGAKAVEFDLGKYPRPTNGKVFDKAVADFQAALEASSRTKKTTVTLKVPKGVDLRTLMDYASRKEGTYRASAPTATVSSPPPPAPAKTPQETFLDGLSLTAGPTSGSIVIFETATPVTLPVPLKWESADEMFPRLYDAAVGQDPFRQPVPGFEKEIVIDCRPGAHGSTPGVLYMDFNNFNGNVANIEAMVKRLDGYGDSLSGFGSSSAKKRPVKVILPQGKAKSLSTARAFWNGVRTTAGYPVVA